MVTQQRREQLGRSPGGLLNNIRPPPLSPGRLPIGSIRRYPGTLSLTQGNRSLGKLRRSATRQTACTLPTVLTTPSTHHHHHIHNRHLVVSISDLDPVPFRLRPRRQR